MFAASSYLLPLSDLIRQYPIPILISLVIFNFLWNKFHQPGLAGIPGPPLAAYSRLWRVAHVWKGSAHLEALLYHDKYGPIVRIGPKHVSIADPKYIPTIYSIKQDYTKTAFYPLQSIYWEKQLALNSFSVRDQERHKILKRQVGNAYSLASLLQCEKGVDSCIDLLMQRLDGFASQNQVVDLGPWLQYYAFDVVGMFTFDKKFGFLEQGKDIDSIMSTIEFILAYSAVIGQIPALHLLLLGNPLLIKLMPPMEQWNQIVQFTLKAMRERAEVKPGGEYTVSNTDGKDFLSKLASPKSSEDEKMNVRDLVIALAGNVFAGSDTTAIALRAIVYYLCRYPECLAKLADEIMKLDKDSKLSSPINFKEASAIPYLSAVIKEAMRLHPSVGLILERHVPPQGVEIEGHFLPSRTVVGVNPWVTGRNAEMFPQPNEFRPERWLEVPEQELRAMDNLLEFNFGAGARKCLGRHMAWIEMMKVIPELIRRFEIEFADPGRDWHVTNHWFVQQEGLVCKLRRRQ